MSASKDVIVYVTEYCPYCHAAKDLLASKGVEFSTVDVTNDPDMRAKLVEMSGGRTTVPQIFVNNENIGGYDELVKYYESGKTI